MSVLSKVSWISAATLLIPSAAFYVVILPLFSWVPDREVPENLANLEQSIVLDLKKQVVYGFEKDDLVHKYLAVTGRTANPTPPGGFKIVWKARDYHSREYDAPMPFSMFFVPERGIAIHGSQAIPWRWRYNDLMPGMPKGSGGCVSLTKRNAEILFDWAKIGTPVVVVSGLDKGTE